MRYITIQVNPLTAGAAYIRFLHFLLAHYILHRALCSLFQPDTDVTRASKCRQFSLQRRVLDPISFQY